MTRVRQRRGRPGYDLDSLLDVCVQEFTQRGYEATSIGTLAEALHVTKAAIYHHVDSKESLLALALERALDQVEDVITGAEQLEGNSLDRVEWLLGQSVRLLVQERGYVALLLRLRGNSPVERDAMERRRAAAQRIEALISAAGAEGSIRPDLDPRATTRLMLGLVNSTVDWYRTDGPTDVDALVHTVRTILLDGLRPRD